jgi:hypothetical protein
MKKFCIVLALLLSLMVLASLLGCTGSWKHATNAFDRSNQVEDSVVNAFFLQGWGMNRALITEAREKFEAQAKLALERSNVNGQVSTTQAAYVIDNFSTELGTNEIVTSQNFAYMAMLMTLYERAESLEGSVDFYLASKKPLLLSLSEEARENLDVIGTEINKWKPVIGNLIYLVPKTLLPKNNTVN